MKDSFWQRLFSGVCRMHARSDWPDFVGADWPSRIMAVPVTDRFFAKQGRTLGRLILHKDQRRLSVYLKRHYRLPWWHGWLALLWPSRAWSPALQEWRHLEWARQRGFPVPNAAAVAEFVGPWGKLQSVLAVEELAGMLPLHEAIPLAWRRLAPAGFARWKRGLIEELARLTQRLHGLRRFHKDLYLCHFYVAESDIAPVADWHGRICMIDLHRLAHHPLTRLLWEAKDLGQLLYSSEIEGVTARDRLRFWRRYLGDRCGLSVAWLRWCVLFKWRSYRRHNDKTKAGGAARRAA